MCHADVRPVTVGGFMIATTWATTLDADAAPRPATGVRSTGCRRVTAGLHRRTIQLRSTTSPDPPLAPLNGTWANPTLFASAQSPMRFGLLSASVGRTCQRARQDLSLRLTD